MSKTSDPSRRRWHIGLIWYLLFTGLCGLGVILLSPARAAFQPQALSISLRSVLTADYSADARPTRRPPESLSLVADVLHDQLIPASDLPGRLATLDSQLKTPVPSVTPVPSIAGQAVTHSATVAPTATTRPMQISVTLPDSQSISSPFPTLAMAVSPAVTPDTLAAMSTLAAPVTPIVALTQAFSPSPPVTMSWTPTQSDTSALTATNTPTPTMSRTLTSAKTFTPTATRTPTKTTALTATVTWTPTPTDMLTATTTWTPTPTDTPPPTNTSTPTASSTATNSPMPTASPTAGLPDCYTGTPGGLLPSDDTWIGENSPTHNYGADSSFEVRVNNGADRRGLVRFDLSAIPANSAITSATLYLYESGNTPNQITYLYRVTTSWAESSATWNFPWITPGGDFDPGIAYTSFIPDRNNCMLTLDLTALVQAWVDGMPNHGFMLYSTGSNHPLKYSSKEEADTGQQPKLHVLYAAPTPVP